MKYVVVLVAGLMLAGCSKQEEEGGEVVRPVKVVEFGSMGVTGGYSYPGRVHANQTVQVAFEVPGKINELPVAKGQTVKQGDLLARLDQRDYANDLESSTAAAEEAGSTLKRLEQASKSGAVPQVQVDEARARARMAEADVKIKQKALDDSEIHADFDGIVADRYFENFQNIMAKESILLLQDISKLEVRVNVPEADVAQAPLGNLGRVVAVFPVFPDREFELTLKEAVSEADQVTQTYRVTFVMPNPDEFELLPGMTATVKWYPPSRGAVKNLIPSVAVVGREGESPWVWVVDPETGRVAKREVKVGQVAGDGQVEVLEGLNPGEKVCVAGAHHLRDGMLVRAL